MTSSPFTSTFTSPSPSTSTFGFRRCTCWLWFWSGLGVFCAALIIFLIGATLTFHHGYGYSSHHGPIISLSQASSDISSQSSSESSSRTSYVTTTSKYSMIEWITNGVQGWGKKYHHAAPPYGSGPSGSGIGSVSVSACVGSLGNGDPCTCSRSCLSRFPLSSSSPCSLPQSSTCFEQSDVDEYEYLSYYEKAAQQQTNEQAEHTTKQNSKNNKQNQIHKYSTINPPSFHSDGNCAITFHNVQLIDGNRIVIFGNDTYIDTMFSQHSNTGLLHGRIGVSTVGNPFLNRFSISVVRETSGATYTERQAQCRRIYREPTFVMGSRDHTLGNFYHFHAEFWHLAFFTMANPSVHALRPIPDSAMPGSSTLQWTSSNATIVHYAGSQSYDMFALKLQDFTPGKPLEAIFTNANKDTKHTRYGVECYDQITLGLENTMHLYQTTHIRRQAQPLIDWVDFRYNVSEKYTGRKHGWKVFRDGLIKSATNRDPRPHVVISVRKYPGRYLRNESLIVSLFEKHGFRVSTVLFTPIPIKQTIELVRTAHVFMQVHGAGLCNSLFLHAGSTMIQLLNPIHPLHKPVFPRLAWNVGAEYLEMPISELKDTSVQIDDWKSFEALVVRARENVDRLLQDGASWSPTKPNYFTWPIAHMPAQCGIPMVEYHNQ